MTLDRSAVIVWTIVFSVPTAVLLISWLLLEIKNRSLAGKSKLPSEILLWILTISYAFFIVGAAWLPAAWGDYHSQRRLTTIELNVVLAMIVFLAVLSKKVPIRAWLALSSLVLFFLWLYTLAVNLVS